MNETKTSLFDRLKERFDSLVDLGDGANAPIEIVEVQILLDQIESLRNKSCKANELLGKSEAQLYSCHQRNRNIQKSINVAISNFNQDEHFQGMRLLEMALKGESK